MPELSFGPYVLVRRIAVGGMAEVYLARLSGPRGFEKPLVVKQILPQLARDPDLLQMFFDEAQIISKLSHPGIVQIFDFGQHDGTFYLAMEYVDGLDLDELIRVARRSNGGARAVPVGHAVQIVSLLARAVHYAHEAKDRDGTPLEIIHRDISPQNVLLGRDGGVKLGDFGIARTKLRAVRTQTGVLRGKIAYVAPERFAGEPASIAVDVYAIGVVLFEAISGKRPFSGDDAAFIKAVMTQEAPALSSVLSDVDPALNAVVSKALARKPEQRFASALAFAEALDALRRSSNPIELSDYVSAMCELRDAAKKERGSGEIPALSQKPKRATETLPGRPEDAAQLVARGETERGTLNPPLDAGEPTVVDASPRPSPILAPTMTSLAVEAPLPQTEFLRPEIQDSTTAPAASGPVVIRLFDLARIAPRRVAAAVAALGIFAGWLISGVLFGGPESDEPLASAVPQGVIAAEEVRIEAPIETPIEDAEPPPPEPAPEPVKIEAPAPEPEPLELEPIPVGVTEPLPQGEADAPLDSAPKTRPKRAAPPPPPAPKPKAAPPPAIKPAAPVKPAVASSDRPALIAKAGHGELTLDTEPWSNVKVDGTSIGPTPHARLSLAAGKHKLVLENPEQKLSKTIVITIRAGTHKTMRISLAD